MKPQVHVWPKFVGGPAHGQDVPELDANAALYLDEEAEQTVVYRDAKFRYGNIAIRAFIWGNSGSEMVPLLSEELAAHALANIGIEVDRSEDEMHGM